MPIEATIPLLFRSRVRKYPDTVVQAYKNESGKFIYRTYRDLYTDVLDIATALAKLGVMRGDHIGIISDNRREWLISDLAIQSLGAADVPRGCDSSEKEITFILSTTDCKLAFIENKNQLTKILNSREVLPALRTLIIFNGPTQDDYTAAQDKNIKLLSFENIMAEGSVARSGKHAVNAIDVETEIEKGSGEDIATIIFTSGTTGEPKGVMLTQSNYTWQVERTPRVLYGEPGDMWLTVLPVWHSFERLMQYIIIERASGMAYSKPVASVMIPDLAVIRPQIIPGVPRLWEALATGIFRKKRRRGKKNDLHLFCEYRKKILPRTGSDIRTASALYTTAQITRYHYRFFPLVTPPSAVLSR